MSKVLKPYTIVPAHLYVERAADRQLSEIIKDMGRPGYVLVSRQMGKTNMLINAKRRLEDNDSVFVYIDLSNSHDSARSCFRYMIDTAIESSELLKEVGKEIHASRRENDLPSHIEHTKELRTMIRSLKGKLIIILDEIDALTKADFSDKIFAQIRSTYFSRVNYPEYNRLTYVLSGVADPSEIIKDSKISPFNIGEKIYLNDFTKDEYDEFVAKAELKISREARERVYYHANGNPRMTWDICAAVEDLVNGGGVVDPNAIDTIVGRIYLTSYDRPPIDHIRDLVRNDAELRGALVSMSYGKARALPDLVKRRLYLAGIVNHIEATGEVVIKNRIIEHALSTEWLYGIELEDKGLIRTARDAFQDELHEKVVKSYEKYLATNDLDGPDASVDLHLLGISYYRLKRFDRAVEVLRREQVDLKKYHDRYVEREWILGMCLFYLGDVDTAAIHFESVIKLNENDGLYFKSRLNLASCYVVREPVSERAEALYKELEDAVGKVEVPGLDVDEIRCLCRFNMAKIWKARDDQAQSRIFLAEARKVARAELVPTIELERISIADSADDALAIHKELQRYVSEKQLSAVTADVDKPLGYSKDILIDILISAGRYKNEAGKELIDSWLTLVQTNEAGDWDSREILYEVAHDALNEGHIASGLNFMKRAIEESAKRGVVVPDRKYVDAMRYLSLLEEDPLERRRYVDVYVEKLLLAGRLPELSRYDYLIVNRYCAQLSESKRYSDIVSTAAVAQRMAVAIEGSEIDKATLRYWRVVGMANQGAVEIAREEARMVLSVFDSASDSDKGASVIGKPSIESFALELRRFLEPVLPRMGNRIEVKHGRNDWVKVRYLDGTVKPIKYKNALEDIAKGRCVLVG